MQPSSWDSTTYSPERTFLVVSDLLRWKSPAPRSASVVLRTHTHSGKCTDVCLSIQVRRSSVTVLPSETGNTFAFSIESTFFPFQEEVSF